tara:strand:- start:7890 stop:8303 length:414 start_codon:yes stop_codon:yes gene_type:complete
MKKERFVPKTKFTIMAVLAVLSLSACKEDKNEPPLNQEAVARGAKLAEDCKACHNLQGRTNQVGPYLADVLGRKAGSVSGYDYSEAMASQDFTWDAEKLQAFILDTESVVPGTNMAFGGIDKDQAADVVEYIRSLAR